MAIASLERVIDSKFLTKLSRVSSGSSSAGSTSSSSELKGQALYNSLRTGAQNFAAGIQLLNSSVTFLNLSVDTNDKLLEVVEGLEKLVDKANKGNLGASTARQIRLEFDELARSFDDILQKSETDGEDALDTTQLEGALVRAGLDKEQISELSRMLTKIQSPAETTVDASGAVSSDGNPIPLTDFYRSIRAAIFDEDDPTDDRSGFFSKVKDKLKSVRITLETNAKAFDQTRELLKQNMALVRAAGLAFLEISNGMKGTESADAIAESIRSKIRASAPGALSQAHNLEPIMVAGLAALTETTSS